MVAEECYATASHVLSCGFSIRRTMQPFPLHCPECDKIAWKRSEIPRLVLEERVVGRGTWVAVVRGYRQNVFRLRLSCAT
jgi:hypothetical protein